MVCITISQVMLLAVGLLYLYFLRIAVSEGMKAVRIKWCLGFGISGAVLITFWLWRQGGLQKLDEFFGQNIEKIWWCLGASAIGISLGLWNSRDKTEGKLKEHKHYRTYFVFVFVAASLTAFVVLSDNSARSYAASALTGMAVGFIGDSLAGLMEKLIK